MQGISPTGWTFARLSGPPSNRPMTEADLAPVDGAADASRTRESRPQIAREPYFEKMTSLVDFQPSMSYSLLSMNTAQLSPIAEMIIAALHDTRSYTTGFSSEHGNPPTTMAKTHHLRSVVQALVIADDRYKLGGEYSEMGRVQILDYENGRTYQLRSALAIAVDRATRADTLFDSPSYIASPTVLLVYQMQPLGLDLSVAGAQHQPGRSRLEPTGPASYVDTWPYIASGSGSFDPGNRDMFDELGDIGEIDQAGDL